MIVFIIPILIVLLTIRHFRKPWRTEMAKRYYVLLVRESNDGKLSQWGVEFGDYDLDTVRYELQSYVTPGMRTDRRLKIIVTTDDQADIDRRVHLLNETERTSIIRQAR